MTPCLFFSGGKIHDHRIFPLQEMLEVIGKRSTFFGVDVLAIYSDRKHDLNPQMARLVKDFHLPRYVELWKR